MNNDEDVRDCVNLKTIRKGLSDYCQYHYFCLIGSGFAGIETLLDELYVQKTDNFDDNWVKVSLRYIVGTRERRKVRDELFRTILERIKVSDNKLQLASETIEIVPSEE